MTLLASLPRILPSKNSLLRRQRRKLRRPSLWRPALYGHQSRKHCEEYQHQSSTHQRYRLHYPLSAVVVVQFLRMQGGPNDQASNKLTLPAVVCRVNFSNGQMANHKIGSQRYRTPYQPQSRFTKELVCHPQGPPLINLAFQVHTDQVCTRQPRLSLPNSM
jgi:hypothetical protein